MAGNQQIASLHTELLAKTKGFDAALARSAAITRNTEKVITGSMERASKSTRSFNYAQQAGSKSASKFGTVVQQGGYQLQDFVVQVGAGQNAMVAFAQQGSQMLGIFGPAGAVAGAALAIGAITTNILSARSAMSQLADETDDLATSLSRLSDVRLDSLMGKSSLEEQATLVERQLDVVSSSIEKEISRARGLQSQMEHFAKRARGLTSMTRKEIFTDNEPIILLTKFEGQTMRPNTALDKAQERLQERQVEINRLAAKEVELRDQLAEISQKIAERDETNIEAKSKALAAAHEASLARIDQSDSRLQQQALAVQRAANHQLALDTRVAATKDRLAQYVEDDIARQEKLAAAIRRVIDPTIQLAEERAKAEALAKRGFLDASDVDKYIDALEQKQEKVSEFQREMSLMWNNVSDRAGQAFADMVLSGENAFDQLADIVARSMLEIAARMAIINPILNTVFGGFSGFSALPTLFGAPAADGGTRNRPFLAGEKGPELIQPAGEVRVLPAAQTAAMSGGSGGGDTYNLTYNFGGGVSRAELAQVIPQIVERTKAAIFDARLRGGSMARA